MKSNCKLIIMLAAALMCGVTACHKDAQIEPKTPKVTEPDVSFTAATTADFSWEVSFPGKVSSVVKLSQHADMSEATSYGDDTPTSSKYFYAVITGLSPETKYYYCFEAWNPHFDFKSEVKSFTTLTVSKPSVTTSTATNISWTTATVGGNVTNDGNDVVSERGVCWGTSHNPDISSGFSHIVATSAGTGEYTCSITGLAPSTKYYLRAYATNSKGTSYGDEKEFTTMALQKPTVTTASVSQLNFANATAVGGGDVTSDGGDAVTERGIYFGNSPDPATTGIKITASSAGTGNFTCTMTGLVAGNYYVCAFATNGQGTSFGSEKSFSYNPPPIGSINGIFSVSSSKKVYFSQGNLQYRASDGRWRFADHQYDYIGNSNSNISSTYSNYIDLFGWGTSGWNSGAVCYQPWSTSTSYSDYYPGGSYNNNLTGSYANADWGVYNKIYNGGNTAGQWRTLTKDEWVYVFQGRSNASSKYGHGKVNGVCGMILLPDSWTLPSGLSFTAGNSSWSNSYTTEQWAKMEANGAVFLPAAGYRYGTSVDDVGSYGSYWSASCNDSSSAYGVNFDSSNLRPSNGYDRSSGCSVRLVAPAE